MSLMLIVYILGLLGSVLNTLAILIGVSIFGIFISSIFMVEPSTPSQYSKGFRMLKIFSTVALSCLFLVTVLPSTNTSYTMLAAYGVEEVLSNTDTQRIAGKSITLIEKTLDTYLGRE